ncbi:hypothetical protein [Butyrivibrio sp. VCB2006]|uniref:hypothetical protein n=1 Tax=Butyrivibrio sp. VCB2006 TaxID=1280679 RepID=UPI000427E801|nr:hypothetical protein [Butyrivibrio sp. VCB2006]
MDTFNNIFDLAIIIGGVYIMYYAVQMKIADKIKVGVIVPADVNVQGMKDREGFKKYAYPRHVAQGLALTLLGVIGIFLDLIGRGDVHVIIYAIALVVLIIGNLIIDKGKRKFY